MLLENDMYNIYIEDSNIIIEDEEEESTPETVDLLWFPDANPDAVLNIFKLRSTDIKLYSDMNGKQLFSKPYFDNYDAMLNKIVGNTGGDIVGKVDKITYQYIKIILTNNERNMINRFKSILSSSTVFAIPITYNGECTLGKRKFTELYSMYHIALCIGKVNGDYLFI